MTKILTIVSLFIATQCIAQTDNNGNPVFNSVSTSEESVKDFQFISNYYTLKNNIENKTSSVYISDNLTLNEIEKAAINLPSDFFLVTKKQAIISMVMIQNIPTRQFLVINPTTGAQKQFGCSLKGDITENRADEIIKEKFDPVAKIKGEKLYFNDKKLTIIKNEEIKNAVLKLIEKEKLSIGDATGIKILSKEEMKTMILAESKEGGKLDFFTGIKGHEYDGVQIKPGLFTTKLGVALYQWGRANFELGVNTVEDALMYWQEFKGREANQREKDYITKGFKKELEK